jgi:cell division protein FtsL
LTGRDHLRRAITAASILFAIAAAVALYAIGYDTRRLAARVHQLEKMADKADADIAAAKAELTHLSRPERIEPLARAMGLKPPTAQQFVDDKRLPRRTGNAQ